MDDKESLRQPLKPATQSVIPGSPVRRLIAGLALLLAIVLAFGAYQIQQNRTQSLKQAETQSSALAETMEKSIGAILQKTDLTLQAVSDEVVHQTVTGQFQADAIERYIEMHFRRMPELDSLRITNADGMVIIGSGSAPTKAVTVSDRDYFQYLRDHPDAAMVITKPLIGKISGKMVITCVRRITLAGGAFGGVVYAALPVDSLRALLQRVPVGAHGSVCVHRDDLAHVVEFTPGLDHRYKNADTAVVPEAWQALLQGGATASGTFTGVSPLDGITRIYSYRRIAEFPLYLNVGLALDDILDEVRHEERVFAGSLLLFVSLSIVVVRQVQRNWQKSVTAESELQRNYERLQLMQEVAQYHATTVQKLLDFSLEKVIALTESRIGYIYHYSEEKEQFILNSWSRDVMAACTVAESQTVYNLDKTGLWGNVVRERRAIMVNEYAAPSELKKGCPEGHVPLTRFLSVPVFDNDRILAVVGVANKNIPYDLTDQLQLTLMMDGVWKIASRINLDEQILHAGQEWQKTFDSISDSIAIIDANQRIMRCNIATSLLLGREFSDIIGQPCWKLFHHADAPIADCPMNRAKVSLLSETSTVKHGDRWLEVTVDPILSHEGTLSSGIHVVRDVTERKRDEDNMREIQAQLMQNDKLATIGQLAAGVAHEINNPMGFIGSNTATLARYVEKYNSYIEQLEAELRASSSGALPEHIQALRGSLKLDYVMRDISVLIEENNEGIDRVKRIVQDLRTFSRADSSGVGAADLNNCMDSTINIVINEIKYSAELTREYAALPKVHCNAQQINQVFMNLLMNAAHAIQAKGEEVGEIIVRSWHDQENAFMAVSDNGTGIAPENQLRIFDAFYTTKEIGKGTGLGLSISAGIIRKHGGEITLASEVGAGSTFTVRLPLKPPAGGETA